MVRVILLHGVGSLTSFLSNVLNRGLGTAAEYGGPAKFATKIHKSPEKWNATGDLKFLNDWYVEYFTSSYVSDVLLRTYKLGEERTFKVL
jgi:hypothetical protein